jgi:hypothetical protein
MKFVKLDKRYKGHGWGYNYAFEFRKRDPLVTKMQDILFDMYGHARIYPKESTFYYWERNKNWFVAPIDGKRVRVYLKNECDATALVIQIQ